MFPQILDDQDLFDSSNEDNMPRRRKEMGESSSTFHRQSDQMPKTVPSKKNTESSEFDAGNSIFRPQKPPTVSHSIPRLIDSDPPDLDDTPSARPKPTNLFLDDENASDDFNIFDETSAKVQSKPKVTPSENKSPNVPGTSQKKTINLFDDDIDNFDSFLPTTLNTSAKSSHAKTEIKPRNLFEDDEDDDDMDDLFLPQKPVTPRSSILTSAPKKDVYICNLFDAEPPEDDFDSIITETPKLSIPKDAGAAAANLGDKKTPEMMGKTVFQEKKADVQEADPSMKPQQPKKSIELFSTKVNLFDDDDDDQTFENLVTPSRSNTDTVREDISKAKIDNTGDTIAESNKVVPSVQSTKPNIFDAGRLFDDMPSSDDEQLFSKSSTQKNQQSPTGVQSTGEFYNDFSDTVTSVPNEAIIAQTLKTPAKQTISQENLFEDEPKGKELDASAQEKRSDFLKKIDAFSSTNQIQRKIEAPSTTAKQPKKLNIANFDINVNALLPGAKRAKSVEKSYSPEKDVVDEISKGDSSPIATSEKTITRAFSEDNVDSSGRLSNLNRNRVKNLSRRPSTRAGRQQQYQKSKQSEESANDGIDQTMDQTDRSEIEETHSIPTPQVINSNEAGEKRTKKNVFGENITPMNESKKSPALKQRTIMFEEDLDETPQLSPPLLLSEKNDELWSESPASTKFEQYERSKPEKTESEQPALVEKPVLELSISEANNEQKQSEPEVSKQENEEAENDAGDIVQSGPLDTKSEDAFAFLNEHSDEFDDFLSIKSTTSLRPPDDKKPVAVKATPAYMDELPPELDPLDEPSFGHKSDKITSLLSENALSLFGDDDDDFDNDDMFSTGRTLQEPGTFGYSPTNLTIVIYVIFFFSVVER